MAINKYKKRNNKFMMSFPVPYLQNHELCYYRIFTGGNDMRILALVILTAAQLLAQNALAANWGYNDKNGEQHWEALGYQLCGTGKQQSPLNLSPQQIAPNQLQLSYQDEVFNLKSKTYNAFAYATKPSEDMLALLGDKYALQSFHFHVPAEHEVNGERYDMEGHFIHEDKAGRFAVVGIFFKLGAPNVEFEKFLKALPNHSATFDINKFYPADKDYYSYIGSLTTPPCTEGLAWIVMHHPMEVSAEQLATFKEKVTQYNSRGVQPANGRTVTLTK
jgi:carbonic anhydrase